MAESGKRVDLRSAQNGTTVYYGVRGSHALQPEVIEQPKRQKRTRIAVRQKAAADARTKLAAVAAVAVVAAMACVLVHRYALIAVNNIELQNAQAAIENYTKEEAFLDVEIAKRGDMGTVKDIAQNELEMGYPANEQIYYFSYSQADENEPLPETKSENNLFDRMCDWVYDLGRRIFS